MKTVKTALTLLLGLSTIASLTGCATIVHGTSQSVAITSNPANASVWIDRAYAGNTPVIVDMSRRDSHIVTIELEGYKPYEVVFSRHLSGWGFGNMAFGGFVGLAVDAVTGGLYTLTPDQINVELSSNPIVYSKKIEDHTIMVVLEPNASWKKVGNLEAINN